MKVSRNVKGKIIWLAIFLCALALPLIFTLDDMGYKPGDDPPWYFILLHFNESIYATIGFIIGIAFAFYYHEKNDINRYLLLFFSLLWYVPKIIMGIIILCNTTDILDGNLAQTEWRDFDHYHGHIWKKSLQFVYMIAVALGYWIFTRSSKDLIKS